MSGVLVLESSLRANYEAPYHAHGNDFTGHLGIRGGAVSLPISLPFASLHPSVFALTAFLGLKG